MNLKAFGLLIMLGFSFHIAFAGSNAAATAYSRKLRPSFPSTYYVSQGLKYFDTLDTYADRDSKPAYATNVIRWEWYPWLMLTGFKRWMMKLDVLLTLYPTRVINRDCRFFKVQPFCRCRVAFQYAGVRKLVKIYEEFTFNNQGEITFIEAWSDEAKLIPWDVAKDPWGEAKEVRRLSTKIPGLGKPDGLVELTDEQLTIHADRDPEIRDLKNRLEKPIWYWFLELFRALGEHF